MPKTRQSTSNHYWCIKTDLSKSGEIKLEAESVTISDCGSLNFYNEKGRMVFSLSSGNWDCFYAVDPTDHVPLAIEYWEGELRR